ncbi:MAG: DUF3313 domain-containing protein [Pseudomonadota bacterium]
MKIKTHSPLLLVAFALVLAGCAAQQKDDIATEEQYSGYLDNYAELKEVENKTTGQEWLRWISPDLKPGDYTKVYPKPTIFYPKIDPQKLASKDVLIQIRDYFSDAVKKDLDAAGMLADGPGPGVLEIQYAITGVYIGDEGMKAIELLPVAAVIGLGQAATGTRDQIVQIVVEGKATDSESGKSVAEAVYKGVGKDLPNDTTQLTADDVKPVLDSWAANMAQQAKNLVTGERSSE